MWSDIEIRNFEYEGSYAVVLLCSYFIYIAAFLHIKNIIRG
jgi:hypothetical protein